MDFGAIENAESICWQASLFAPMTDDGVPRLKVVVLGNSGCGKTSLIQRWISDIFVAQVKPTVGSNHQRKRVILESGDAVDLYIWDTAGQEQFQALMPLYTRASVLAIIVVAADDSASFESVDKWIETVSLSCDIRPPLVLAVNKMDKTDRMALPMEEIHKRYDQRFTSVFFVSALTGENCEAALRFFAEEAAGHYVNVNRQHGPMTKHSNSGNKDCC
jgi:small GTP-binding protein